MRLYGVCKCSIQLPNGLRSIHDRLQCVPNNRSPCFSSRTKEATSGWVERGRSASAISQIGRRNCRCSAAFDYDITVHLLRLSLSPDLRPERGVEGTGDRSASMPVEDFQHANPSPRANGEPNGRGGVSREAVTNLETNSRRADSPFKITAWTTLWPVGLAFNLEICRAIRARRGGSLYAVQPS